MKRDTIVIHHSLTKDSETVSWAAIEKYHREVNHWADIGYHYGVEQIGNSIQVLVGRPENEMAAAVKEGGLNRTGIHICLVGNFDLAPPSKLMIETLIRRILVPLMVRHNLRPWAIKGHRDFASYKSCPGKLFDLDRLRTQVGERLPN